MTIEVNKGQKVEVTKNNPGLTILKAGMGWDVNKFKVKESDEFDLDVFAFLLDVNGKLVSDDDVVYYNMKKTDGKLMHKSGAILHSGDNRSGKGEGDDETITIDLSKIPADRSRIVLAASVYDYIARNQTFGMTENSYIRILDASKNAELIKFNLGENFSTETAIVAGELYRDTSNPGGWKFSAVGAGSVGGILDIAAKYK